MSFTTFEIPTFQDGRGALTVLQDQMPFAVRRAFWIHGADSQVRGGHRHHKTRQALIALAGTVTVHMDDGQQKEDVVLDHPGRCLLVEPKDWHTMAFGPGAVLLVLASELYDRADYIDTPYA